MSRKALILTAAFAGIAILTAAAGADTFTWNGSTSTSWNNEANWTQTPTENGDVPGAGDDVVIVHPAGIGAPDPTLDVTVSIGSLTVQNSGVLNFGAFALTVTGTVNVQSGGLIDINNASGKLSIGGTDGLDIDAGGTIEVDANGAELELTTATSSGHDVDGSLLLKNAGAFVDIQQNTKLIGDGKVEVASTADGAAFVLASGTTLENAMSAAVGDGFRGPMVIKGASDGNGTFTNNGLVYAENGTFELDSTLHSVGSGNGKWEVASSTDKLRFEEAATELTGAIVLAGELETGAGIDVKTCGELTFNTGAAIDVNSSTFKYQHFNAGSSCANPKDSGTGADCGDNIFVVSSDKHCP